MPCSLGLVLTLKGKNQREGYFVGDCFPFFFGIVSWVLPYLAFELLGVLAFAFLECGPFWLLGFLVSRLLAFWLVWLFGFLVFWLFGFLACLVFWLLGFLGFLGFFGSLAFGFWLYFPVASAFRIFSFSGNTPASPVTPQHHRLLALASYLPSFCRWGRSPPNPPPPASL